MSEMHSVAYILQYNIHDKLGFNKGNEVIFLLVENVLILMEVAIVKINKKVKQLNY